MAKNDMTYTDPDLKIIDEYAEAWSYYLIKASVLFGSRTRICPGTEETKYPRCTINMTYKKDVDELVAHKERDVHEKSHVNNYKKHVLEIALNGVNVRNRTAQISNSTNGIEPIPYVSVK